MNHGAVEVFAYQEALLIMAIFGIAILAMIWAAYRRWLQHKGKMGQQIAEQAAELTAQYGARMERVEERLKGIEQIVSDGGARIAVQPAASPANPLPEPTTKHDEI